MTGSWFRGWKNLKIELIQLEWWWPVRSAEAVVVSIFTVHKKWECKKVARKILTGNSPNNWIRNARMKRSSFFWLLERIAIFSVPNHTTTKKTALFKEKSFESLKLCSFKFFVSFHFLRSVSHPSTRPHRDRLQFYLEFNNIQSTNTQPVRLCFQMLSLYSLQLGFWEWCSAHAMHPPETSLWTIMFVSAGLAGLSMVCDPQYVYWWG